MTVPQYIYISYDSDNDAGKLETSLVYLGQWLKVNWIKNKHCTLFSSLECHLQ